MGLEIERKFLPADDSWKRSAEGRTLYRQSYVPTENGVTFRIRRAGEKGFLTLKGLSRGTVRDECEYPIPAADADDMLEKFCLRPLVEKYRYRVFFEGWLWEIDEFLGENEGLVLAEIELDSPDSLFPHPPWLGREVTGIPSYYNSYLQAHPFRSWNREDDGAEKPQREEG